MLTRSVFNYWNANFLKRNIFFVESKSSDIFDNDLDFVQSRLKGRKEKLLNRGITHLKSTEHVISIWKVLKIDYFKDNWITCEVLRVHNEYLSIHWLGKYSKAT